MIAGLAPRVAVARDVVDAAAPAEATLGNTVGRAVITAGIERSTDSNRATDVFVRRLVGFLASSWDIKLRFVDLARSDVPGALRSGAVDIALTPDPALPADLDFLATFVDGAGTVWRTALRHDDVFAAAILRFVRAAVSSGDYATFYRAAYRAEPQYEPLTKTLLG